LPFNQKPPLSTLNKSHQFQLLIEGQADFVYFFTTPVLTPHLSQPTLLHRFHQAQEMAAFSLSASQQG